MSAAYLLLSFFLFLIIFTLSFFILFTFQRPNVSKKSLSSNCNIPKSYPLIGSSFAINANFGRRVQWTSDILQNSPSATFVLHRPMGSRQIFTGNPANVEHILKTHFHLYQKGPSTRYTLFDFLGNGILNSDGETWKFQRQVSSHEFTTKSLRKFVNNVVENELTERLVPILSAAAASRKVVDLQDILQRFGFDNICKIAFGYDAEYLLPSLPVTPFAEAFEQSVRIISDRFNCAFPIVWKVKKLLGVGSEKRMKETISQVRDFAMKIIKEKKEKQLKEDSSLQSVDLLSRFLSSGISNETFVTDIVISFILAGRDTTSAALTWFFWLLSQNPQVETQILKEIKENHEESTAFEEVKHIIYTHASLCETMRLYPPLPMDSKMAVSDNVLPDGTKVKKGSRVTYHPYAMGRLEILWGPDWAEFKPERWLLEEDGAMKKKKFFIARDSYTYPVFQARPRACLGKEMAFSQMKRVVSGVLSRFKVVPAMEDNVEPELIAHITGKMKGGFLVRIEERIK